MKWVKKGLIFAPGGQFDWMMTHAMLPTADHLEGDIYRIYFSPRDRMNRSFIGYIDVDITDPSRIFNISSTPVLSPGQLGTFDDNGVSPCFIVTQNGRKYLYYFGWNKGSMVRAAEVSGLAISQDCKTFKRYSRSPVIDRTDDEPYQILVISCILIENDKWRMWYDSADVWISPELPRYNIKYAESDDGIHWERKGIVSVDYKSQEESRVSRASVIKEKNIYRMWHCYALGSGGYRMGYAESGDGYRFERIEERGGLTLSDTGWDSEMVCYPFVFRHKGQLIMLYCGNGYGRTGFGYAVWE
jgi:predicted GH43/DUF377 family glycosyl hydrolase